MSKTNKFVAFLKENKEFIIVCTIAAGLYLAGYRRGVKVSMRRK